MSSSGLIYAVIVGAWAAYLVPMWLRRQDELNEARPTERFSTAIRLLAGRSALERRAARALGDEPRDDEQSDDGPPVRDEAAPGDPGAGPDGDPGADRDGDPDADRAGGTAPEPERLPEAEPQRPVLRAPERPTGARGGIEPRARLLARRRRMVTVLFLAFALGAVVAAVSGLAFLWVPAVPATLLTLYIGHLRKLERLRYEVKIDRVRAAQAAERLRKREQQRAEAGPAEEAPERAPEAAEPAGRGRSHLRLATDRDRAPEPAGPASASALAEATEHEEWVDGMRERGAAGPDSWEPVPVPLPTYVTAPVAPRVSRGLDLSAPGTWTAGRPAEARTGEVRTGEVRATEARNTPLFDQYAEPAATEPRRRAANE
ncbi:gephyrin-like molybdotransferase receptor GlpR [Kitasatospora sp. NPDC086009]|uniref:divisome protein SepX/GlpR n=1 Tax=unclassified Kitasatospora TaxID=2633591 RepID=UPI0037CA3791